MKALTSIHIKSNLPMLVRSQFQAEKPSAHALEYIDGEGTPCSNRFLEISMTCSARRPVAPPNSTIPSRPPGFSSSNTSTDWNRKRPWKPNSTAGNTVSSSIQPIAGEPGPPPRTATARSTTTRPSPATTCATSSTRNSFPISTSSPSGQPAQHHRIQDRPDLRRNQKPDPERLRPA